MLRRIKNALFKFIKNARKKTFIRKINHVLESKNESDCSKAESMFTELQRGYEKRPEYGYDPRSVYLRASLRVQQLLNIQSINMPGLRGLEIGAGDGMVSTLLQTFGHSMVISDYEDWRVDSAQQVEFIKADCCVGIPLSSESFDFVVSYNSFEHFTNPLTAFSEILRLTKKGGIIHLSFGPLYCSPWGLHAYRMLLMPYPQYLFTDVFIDKKLDEIGIWDLGKRRTELQYLNEWKPSQYEKLWRNEQVKVLSCTWHRDDSHLDLINKYPDSFRGRNLSVDDLVISSVEVTIQKR